MFIVMEGIDGCGKSTQAQLLKKHFEDKGVILTFEPGNTAAGKILRQMILTDTNLSLHPRTELLLFNADRVEHVEKVIRPALVAGQTVICDRYIYSTIAYQVAGRGFDREIVDLLNKFTIDQLLPDYVFYIDIAPQVSLSRIKQKDKFENEKLNFYQKVRAEYQRMVQQETNFYLLDGNKTIEQIHMEILEILTR